MSVIIRIVVLVIIWGRISIGFGGSYLRATLETHKQRGVFFRGRLFVVDRCIWTLSYPKHGWNIEERRLFDCTTII
jgi:hypothetical protein